MEFASPELEVGQTVDVVVLHDSNAKGHSIMEILNSGPFALALNSRTPSSFPRKRGSTGRTSLATEECLQNFRCETATLGGLANLI